MILALASLSGAAQAQLFLDQEFTGFATSTLTGQGNWTAVNGATTVINVATANPLTLPAYPYGGGEYIQLTTPGGQNFHRIGNGTGVAHAFVSERTYYLSFLLRLDSVGADENAHIISPTNSAGIEHFEHLRVHARQDGDGFNIGLSEGNGLNINGDSRAIAFGPTRLNFGETYHILARYDAFSPEVFGSDSDDQYLWINPILATSPPTTASAEVALDAPSGDFANDILNQGDMVDAINLNHRNAQSPVGAIDSIRYARGVAMGDAWTTLDVIDRTPPTLLSIARATPMVERTNANTLIFDLTFDEPVVNVTADDFVITGTTAAVVEVTGSGSAYALRLADGGILSYDGILGIDLAPGQDISDVAGNALPSTEPATDETYELVIVKAFPDPYQIAEGDLMSVAAATGVLVNDTSLIPAQLVVDSVAGADLVGMPVSPAAGGQITVNADGSFVFDSGQDFEALNDGEEVIVEVAYRSTDGDTSAVSMILITVAGRDDALNARPDMFVGREDSQLLGNVLEDNGFGPDFGGEAEETLVVTSTGDVDVSGIGGTAVLAADGSFTYVPPADSAGDAVFEYTITDGLLSVSGTVTISVNAVNDAPTFQVGLNQTRTDLDPRDQTVPLWASAISAGPADEVDQELSFATMVTSDPDGVLESVGVAPDGSLSYTLSGNLGVALVDLTLSDDGGTTFSGLDTSDTQSFSVTVEAAPVSDLRISKTDGVTATTTGQPLTYLLVATNDGPEPVAGALVEDIVPAGLTDVSWTCVGTAGAACPASGSGDIQALVDLAVGASVTFSLSATVAADAAGTLTNTATVTAPATTNDPNPDNDSATDETDVEDAVADLSITKSDGTASVGMGGLVDYLITVTNAGPDDAFGAAVTDVLPAELTAASWICDAGPGASCAAAGTGDIEDLVDLPAGASVTYTLSVTIDAPLGTVIENTATVTAPASAVDPMTDDNAATDRSTVADTVYANGFEPLDDDGKGLAAKLIRVRGLRPQLMQADDAVTPHEMIHARRSDVVELRRSVRSEKGTWLVGPWKPALR